MLKNELNKIILIFSLLSLFFCAVLPFPTLAQSQSNVKTAKVSFTFDDGFASAATKAAPLLAEFGMSGTAYVTTNYIGQANRMNWNQVTTLQNHYGWEIGSHSVSHPLMTQIGTAQLNRELSQSKQLLEDYGLVVESFATPYGDYNNKVLAATARYYTSHRPFHDQGYAEWPYSDYLLYVKQVQSGVSVEQVKSYIDEANARKAWLILVFHDIKNQPSVGSYEYGTDELKQIATYVKTLNLPVVNISNGILKNNQNLLNNGNFDNGLINWSTDAPTKITTNYNSKGSYPTPRTSIKLLATDHNIHLFSSKVAVSSNLNYVLKTYVNIEQYNQHELAFYIDEYNNSGEWVSGQYKIAERSAFVERLNFSYSPTSSNVSHASLQVIVQANSGIRAFIDNVEWFIVY